MESEQQLVHDVKKGNRGAMRRLYNRYSGYAMAVALRYVPDRDDAADVVQDSFVKVFTSVEGFEWRGEGTLKLWIARIVANESLGFLRKRGKLTFTDEIPDEAVGDEPEIDAVSEELLRRMIAALPEGYRVVLNLYVFGGLSHKEIAGELGVSPSTSASQFFHAKTMLARMIKAPLQKNLL